jgi:hypothetical protein
LIKPEALDMMKNQLCTRRKKAMQVLIATDVDHNQLRNVDAILYTLSTHYLIEIAKVDKQPLQENEAKKYEKE